ncbi:trehalose/maltose transport system permease protein [Thermosporothrix hazakensis]|jgi:ABC-type sugar transport system permease subunit|uniref:Trehalose/maltose transport system permease protein n=2 Tax=Thermosporothrix TaxID=768650 RepID=A0A326U4Y4_THEHA|nr:sugar ABC transporter permease [Thermosporothrix hazakensis]PZW24666.1 trehalose/maltose transport system permease protein [Thermosporothrix hazakensis]BBH90350.1 ABC transporter permease [Thermosporothrix sp. COM3]GCE48386.1 ABC transporter permease [Thermosporothrix hazakensis]
MTTFTARPPQEKKLSLFDRIRLQGGFLPYALVLPTILLILIIAIYPMLDSIRLSFLDNPLLEHPAFIWFRNYTASLRDDVFQQAFLTTIIFMIGSVTLESIIGLGIALLINKTFPGRGLVRAAILVPWAFPTVVSAQMWLLMYNDQTGIMTYILRFLHLLGPSDSLIGSYWGVIAACLITDVWKTTPFMALLLLAGLQVIPAELYEAADVDGASRWQRFWRITLPMLKGAFLIALLFRALDAIRVFDIFYVFGQRSVPSLATFASQKLLSPIGSDFSQGVAVSVVIFLLGVIISLIFLSFMREGTRQQR